MDKKQQYIEYIDKLYRRQLDSVKTQGATTWVLLTAMVFILWRILPHSHLLYDASFLNSTLLIYFHTYFSIVLVHSIVKPNNSFKNATAFDYRIVSTNNFDNKANLIFLLVSAALPLFFGLFTVTYSAEHTVYFHIASWPIFLFLILILSFLLFHKQYEKKTGYPHPSLLRRHPKTSRLSTYAKVVSVLLEIALLIANLISLWICLEASGNDRILANSIEVGFCLAILNLLIILFFRKLQQSDVLTPYLRLERDIVLHGLKEQEIKNRIEQDLIGNEDLSSWLVKKQAEIEALKDEFDGTRQKTLNLVSKLTTDTNGKPGIQVTQIRNSNDEMDKAFKRYNAEVEKFNFWMRSAISQLIFSDDPFFEQLLIDNLEKSIKRAEELNKRLDSTQAKTESVLEEINEKVSEMPEFLSSGQINNS